MGLSCWSVKYLIFVFLSFGFVRISGCCFVVSTSRLRRVSFGVLLFIGLRRMTTEFICARCGVGCVSWLT